MSRCGVSCPHTVMWFDFGAALLSGRRGARRGYRD